VEHGSTKIWLRPFCLSSACRMLETSMELLVFWGYQRAAFRKEFYTVDSNCGIRDSCTVETRGLQSHCTNLISIIPGCHLK
jgi:hypothetical protein